MPSQAGALRVLSCNVNGLRDSRQRIALFERLRAEAADIVVLQETHCSTDEEATQWVQQGAGPGAPWAGHAFWQHGNNRQRGVAILLRAGLVPVGQSVAVEYNDHGAETGRLLRVGWDAQGTHFSVLAVYAPHQPAGRPAFFSGAFADAVLLPGLAAAALIVAGDFNCVLHERDIRPAPGQLVSGSCRLVGSQELQLVCAAANLVDAWRHLHPHSAAYTHTAAGPQPSAGRIDACFVSESLDAAGWLASARHLHDFPVGDHAAVLVQLRQPDAPPLGPQRWIFPSECLASQQFETSLTAAIAHFKATCPQQLLADHSGRWEALKQFIKAHTACWHVQQRLGQQQQRRSLQQQLRLASRLADLFPCAATAARLLAAKRALQLHDQEQAAQRAATRAVVDAVYGEGSTYYFHRLGKPPADSQLIQEVHDPAHEGGTVSLRQPAGTQRAANIFADFYDAGVGGLFAVGSTTPADQHAILAAVDSHLTEEDCRRCAGAQPDGSVSVAEAAAALASLPRGKSPGSDGLTYEFYAAFWPSVGDWLVASFNQPFLDSYEAAGSPQLSASQRLGLVMPVYKGGSKPRAAVSSYRPITLLNCDLKIIAKVMVQRIGPALASVIDATQTAFVPGRQIFDNVLSHLEEIDYLREQQQPGVFAFLDFAQAYDRLDRGWLGMCMSRLGLPAVAIRWVELLLRGTQGQILFNRGQTSRVFPIASGCAQGSPLSPLLYVMAAQPLAARCRQLQRAGLFASIALPGGQPAPCCHQHADDTTLHAAGVDGIQVLLTQAVQPFCRASGAQLNLGKTQGLSVGSHQQLVGPEPVTGITFVDTSAAPVRHLGILLDAGGAEVHARRMYTQCLQSIAYRVQLWSRHSLSVQGRCEVAKQVLGSCLSYHQQFVQPPADVMQRISKVVLGFVLGRGLVPEQGGEPLRGRPARSVASLPKAMGGLGQVDLQAHCLALQAKVAAQLLHPKRAPWKQFMAASLEQALPGLGAAALTQSTRTAIRTAVQSGSLSARHAGYLQAFQQVGLHRHVPHAAMSQQQVLLEPLVGNHSVGSATDGTPFTSTSALPAALRAGSPLQRPTQLRQVRHQLHFQPAADGLLLPEPWQQALTSPAPASWECDQHQQWARQLVAGQWQYRRIMPDGKLRQAGAQVALQATAVTGWAQCCVVDVRWPLHPAAVGHEQQRRQRQHQQSVLHAQRHGLPPPPPAPPPAPDLYLVGEWSALRVDPSVWGFGPLMGVLQYTVKGATRRLLQSQMAGVRGWEPGVGIRPRLWRGSDGQLSASALADMEAGQKRSWQAMMAAPSGSRQVRVSDEQLVAAYDAPWMHQSPPRLHPRQRVAAAATAAVAAATLQRQQQQQQQQLTEPRVDDLADPLTGQIQLVQPSQHGFVRVWRRLWHRSLPRDLQWFGWRLQHAALPVGAVKARYVRPGHVQQLLEQACHHPQCQSAAGSGQQPPLETLSHLFLECPVAVQVWDWFAALWGRVMPGVALTASAALLLRDDDAGWQPPVQLSYLWLHLRLLLLQSLWVVRCRSAGTPAHTAPAVVSRFVAVLRQHVCSDWQRVVGDIRWGTGMPAGWFRGRDPRLSREAFAHKWCVRGVIAALPSGGVSSQQLVFRLTAQGV